MNRIFGLGLIILLIVGCQQEATKTGVVGQQFILKADIPNEVGKFDYIWKITDLPEGSELMLSDIQFSDDESQVIFIPDVTGHFTIQVTIWKYNDKLGAYVYNYDIAADTSVAATQQTSNDNWLNETVDVAPIAEENDAELTDEIESVKPKLATAKKPNVIEEKPAVPKVQPTAITEANYTIQVAAEPTADAAAQHVNRLVNAGYDAYSLEYKTTDNKTLYRIRIGKYATREEALKTADKITNDQGLSTWVTQY